MPIYEPNPLNEELALLTGYQWRNTGHTDGCRFLSPLDTPEGNDLLGINFPLYSIGSLYPFSTGDEKLCGDYNRYVPRYCEDDMACMNLQRRISQHETVHALILSHDKKGMYHCEIQFGPMNIARCDHEDLRMAVASAARDFLRELASGPLYDPMVPSKEDDLPLVGDLPPGWQPLETIGMNDLVTNEQTGLRATCPDCGVEIGTPHDINCDVARCLVTGGQRLSCDNHRDRTDCGEDIWTGKWPGVMECEEFGWYSIFTDRGWQSCTKDTPGATADLNRLADEGVWDVTANRFRRPGDIMVVPFVETKTYTQEQLEKQILVGVRHLQDCASALRVLGVTAYERMSWDNDKRAGVMVSIGEIPQQVRMGYGWPEVGINTWRSVVDDPPPIGVEVEGYDEFYCRLHICTWDGELRTDDGKPGLMPVDGTDDVCIETWRPQRP